MAAGAAAAETMLRFVLGGRLSIQEIEVDRRPYHRNCSCGLHNLKGSVCSSVCSRTRNISFMKRKTWNDCSLSMADSQSSLIGSSSVRNMESMTSARFAYIDDSQNM